MFHHTVLLAGVCNENCFHMKTHRLQYWGSCILGEHVIKLFPNCLWLSKLHRNWQGRALESKYKLEYLAMVGSWVSQKPLSIRHHVIPLLKTALQWGKAHHDMACFYTHILSSKSLVHNGAGFLGSQSYCKQNSFAQVSKEERWLYTSTHTIVAHSTASCCMSSVMSAFLMMAFLSCKMPDFFTIFFSAIAVTNLLHL